MGITEKGRSYAGRFDGTEQTQYRSEEWSQVIIINQEADKLM